MDAQSGTRPKTGYQSGSPRGEPGPGTTTGQQDKTEVSELVDHAKQTATETASSAGNMIRQRVDDQYHRLGQRLDDMIKSMNQAADSLDDSGSPGAGNLVHSATRQMERVSGYVQRTGAEDVLSDANQYARQHPWTVIVGGLAIGLAASRFLKPPADGGSSGGEPGDYPAGGGYESGTSYQAAV
jgi:ElaB/YqjD/DUF883 family membrane-anchored ribosome-binding protein